MDFPVGIITIIIMYLAGLCEIGNIVTNKWRNEMNVLRKFAYGLVCCPAIFVQFIAQVATAEETPEVSPRWTTEKWTIATPAPDNILSPLYIDNSSSYNLVGLSDHVYDWNIEFRGNCDVVWNLPKPATVSAINIYGGWLDSGRDDIYVSSVSVKYSVDGEWVELSNSNLCLDTDTAAKPSLNKARYAMSDGSTLASGIVALKIKFPSQESQYVGLFEIELCGTFDETIEAEEFPYTYDFGDYAPGNWVKSKNNMMGLCTSIFKNLSDVTSSCSYMIDGSVQSVNSSPFSSGSMFTWNFSRGFDLDSFKVFSRWGDNGRDAIVIYRFEVKEDRKSTRLNSSHVT